MYSRPGLGGSPTMLNQGNKGLTKVKPKGSLPSKAKKAGATRPKKAVPIAYDMSGEIRSIPMRVLPPSRRGSDVRVVGRDYSMAVNSATSAAATAQVITMNSTLFPRLVQQAYLYQNYRFNRLSFLFVGRSASTQKGNIGVGSIISLRDTGSYTVDTEAAVKNLENAVVIQGFLTGSHEVPIGESALNWYPVYDASGTAGDSLQRIGTLFWWITATTAAGDLSWDLYVDYDIEFSGRCLNTTNALAMEKVNSNLIRDEVLRRLKAKGISNPSLELLLSQIEN